MRGDQLARQWQLIQILARSHSGAGLEDLASKLNCVRRTVYRDLNALMFAGFPVVSEKRDGRVYYKFIDTFRLGDIPFTADEVLALVFSEDLLQSLKGTVFHDSIQSAIHKIRTGLGPELTEFMENLGTAFHVFPEPHKDFSESSEVIQILNRALLERCSVDMKYHSAHAKDSNDRFFDPYRIWYKNGGLYAIGLDHRSEELRTFAIDRIVEAKQTNMKFHVLPDFDFDSYVESSFGIVAGPIAKVKICFEPEIALTIQEKTWHPSQTFYHGSDGRLILTMRVSESKELQNWILSFGKEAEVLEPISLRNAISSIFSSASKRYDLKNSQKKTTGKRA